MNQNQTSFVWLVRLALLAIVVSFSSRGLADEPYQGTDQGTSREQALQRVTADIKFLASDEMAGRLPGTPEMQQCVDYILADFKKIGLKPAMPDGTYLQTFDVGANLGGSRELNKATCKLTLTGPSNEPFELTLDEQFKPQFNARSVDLNADLVFVGYGIKADEHNYDEYRNVDVKGKIVVLIRVEPQQTNPDSVFDGKENSSHARIQTKVAAARDAGAAGIIIVNDRETAPDSDHDELSPYDMFGNAVLRMPFAHIKRATVDQLLKKLPIAVSDGKKLGSLVEIENYIDERLEPVSSDIVGWKANMTFEFTQKEVMTSNLIGVIEGEGPFADETIVIGGHYDHLGRGAYGSRAPGRNEIHNGADDNATGTAGVMELARRFMKRDKKPARRLVFICFTAEEMGLIGAQYYVQNPVFPLDKTVAMVNFDMIGWLREDKVTIFDWNSSDAFAGALDRANQGINLNLQKPASGFAGSDHLPFRQRGIPVMFLHTGLTGTYHTPEDDFETINCDGALKVTEFTEKLLDELANLPEAPKLATATSGPPRFRLGVMLSDSDGTVVVDSVMQDSAAEKIGLQAGDVILEFAGEKVTARREVNRLLSSNAKKTVKLKIRRGSTEQEMEVKLGE